MKNVSAFLIFFVKWQKKKIIPYYIFLSVFLFLITFTLVQVILVSSLSKLAAAFFHMPK